MRRFAGRIVGKVQRVGFRWFVQTEAERLHIHGWVRNTHDGHVEFEAEGDDERMSEFLARIAKGPPSARVSEFIEIPASDETLRDFEVRR